MDALLTISHHLQKSLDAGWSLILFSLTWCCLRWSQSQWSLFKLKYIGVDGRVLSICREFISNRWQRAVVDGATSEWIPIVSGAPQGSVLGPLLFILYTSEMFEMGENRAYACGDDSILLAVVRSPADRHAVAAPLTRTWRGFRSGAITGA